MPAKAKVTKEMIVDAAFAIAREAGAENINARTVSERLHCSTQPVMYHFATMEELKKMCIRDSSVVRSDGGGAIRYPLMACVGNCTASIRADNRDCRLFPHAVRLRSGLSHAGTADGAYLIALCGLGIAPVSYTHLGGVEGHIFQKTLGNFHDGFPP